MQTNVAMKADYTGDLSTNEAHGYGGELESGYVSNNNSFNYSPRVPNGGSIELQPLMGNSQNADSNTYAEIVSRMQTIGSEIGKPDEETGEIESWNKNHILPLNMHEGRVLFDHQHRF